MARKKTKTTTVADEPVIESIIKPTAEQATFIKDDITNMIRYTVELYNQQSKSRTLLADKATGGVAVFNSTADAKVAAQDFLKLINGVIPYSYYIREYR